MVCYTPVGGLSQQDVEALLLQKLAKSISLAQYPVLGLQVFAAVYRSRLRLLQNDDLGPAGTSCVKDAIKPSSANPEGSKQPAGAPSGTSGE
ncbi:unnamed protein product [Notodromas monacha]|uniref:Uncharacterized protein n=1 Tax=Notodromas monacha TaxID=399045 RepID=A0A7R9BVC4_9CRUS|nr:unnamed protein product [Notodromas monacha]CAG0921371.1 unnamed protein product [Notodromas monacha]